MRRLALAAVIGVLALASMPAAAQARLAPQYVSSEPSDGEELHKAPDNVSIEFSEPLDQSSRIVVTDECGRRVDDGSTEVFANTMEVGLESKARGHYEVAWLAVGLGGVSGRTAGDLEFHVHMGEACGDDAGPGHGGHGPGHGGPGENGKHEDKHQQGHKGSRHDPTGHDQHTTQTSTHDGHGQDAGGHARHDASMGKHDAGEHDRHTDHAGQDAGPDSRPLEDAGPARFPAADAAAAITGLILAVGLGLLGGWYLRISAPAR